MKNQFLYDLEKILQQRKNESADSSYVSGLYAKGEDAILKKIGEEAAEVVMATKDNCHAPTPANKEHLVHEVADLWFHSMVLLAQQNSSIEDVIAELESRHKKGAK